MSYAFEQLTPSIGSRIRDVDLSTASDELIVAIQHELATRGVVHVPGQFLQGINLENFAKRLGQPWIGDFLRPIEGLEFVTPIRNRGKSYAISERWHADSTYAVEPPYITLLSAVDIPPLGGDTQWCNQYLVYEQMPETVKQIIKHLKAVHYNRGQVYVRTGVSRDDLEGFAHPLVIRHPVTGLPSFYLSAHAEHLEGLGRSDGAPLVEWLRQFNGSPAFSYRHQWQPGDLMIWDNRNTTHYAVHDYDDYPRYMQRITISGPQPEAFFA